MTDYKKLCERLNQPIEGANETIATAAHINAERATAAEAIERLSGELEDAKDAAKKVADDIAYNWLPNIKRREQESSREKAMHNAIVDDCIKHVLNYVPEAK